MMSSPRSRNGGRFTWISFNRVEEVFPKLPLIHRSSQVDIRAGEDLTGDRDLLLTTKPSERLILDRLQKLRLKTEANVPDFVEEQGAAIGQLEKAAFGSIRTRIGASLVSEQLRFEEVLGDRRIVYFDEKLASRSTVVVYTARKDHFIRPGLAKDQNGDLVDFYYPFDDADNLADLGAVANNAAKVGD